MRALVVRRKPAKFVAARTTSHIRSGVGAALGMVSLDEIDPPSLPGPEWVRLSPRMSGICGSDLSMIDGRSSRWFEPIVSFPFVPGHEVVADDDQGRRVVIEPVLGCVTRGIDPPCPPCAAGNAGNCARIDQGCLQPGLQTGYCCDTGGGWSTTMVAHRSQLHQVPDDMSDREAVMVEPTACAIHAVLRGQVQSDETVAVIGAGSLGLLTLGALNRFSPPRRLVVGARYPHQQIFAREFSTRTGEISVVEPTELPRRIRSLSATNIIEPTHTNSSGWARGGRFASSSRLGSGADVTFDCVGSAESIATALAVTRPRGRVVLVGMPGVETIDMTPLWQREINLMGAYTYGNEIVDGAPIRTFELAIETVQAAQLGRLVSTTYALERYEDAIAHAGAVGRRGSVKIAFAPVDAENQPTPRLTSRKVTRR